MWHLLLLRAKEFQIEDNEMRDILLLVYVLKEIGVKTVTPQLIQSYSTLSNQELNKVLGNLLDKKLIYNHLGAIDLNNLTEKLLQNKEAQVEKENDFDLIAVFEEQFGRALTPIEFNIIKEWVKSSVIAREEMILKALKEAVKSQVLTLRYIEGILINWAQNGVKKELILNNHEPKRVVTKSDYKWWEDE